MFFSKGAPFLAGGHVESVLRHLYVLLAKTKSIESLHAVEFYRAITRFYQSFRRRVVKISSVL